MSARIGYFALLLALAFFVNSIAFGQTGMPKCEVRVYNIDDRGRAIVNLTKVLDVRYKGDQKADITHDLVEGDNYIRFNCENASGDAGYTYTFEIIKNNEKVWGIGCGKAGFRGCKNDDKTPGMVCDITVAIDNNCNFRKILREPVKCPRS